MYLAGQVAQSVPGKSVATQTQAILDQIDGLLAEAGSDKTKILSATIWICSMDDFVEMNSVGTLGCSKATPLAVLALGHDAWQALTFLLKLEQLLQNEICPDLTSDALLLWFCAVFNVENFQ